MRNLERRLRKVEDRLMPKRPLGFDDLVRIMRAQREGKPVPKEFEGRELAPHLARAFERAREERAKRAGNPSAQV